jgi:hypothetical protein
MNTKTALRQHTIIPRSLDKSAFVIDLATASAALGTDAENARSTLIELSDASAEQAQRILSSMGLTLTLVPSAMAELAKGDITPPAKSTIASRVAAHATLEVIGSKIARTRSAGRTPIAANDEVTTTPTLASLSQAAARSRLTLAIVSADSSFAKCARVMSPIRGQEKPPQADAVFYDSLVEVAAPQDVSTFRARPDLHVAALLDRMYFTGAAIRITYPDGEECDAYTSEDIADAVAYLQLGVKRQATANELGLSLPMYDALATRPGGHRTSTLMNFLRSAGANAVAVKSERKLGWVTSQAELPTRYQA